MDSTQLWVIVLGILSVLLAGIVFYSLRRLLMLRDAVLKSTDLITVLEKQQEFTKHLLEGDLIPKIDNTSQTQGQTIEKLLGDIRTINSQLNKVHDQVQDHENRIQNVTKRLKQVEVKAEALNSRERIVDPAADQQQASAGGASGKGKAIGAYSNVAQSSSPSGGAGLGAGSGGGVYSEVMDSIQRRLLNDSSLAPPSSPIHNNNNNSSVLSLLQRSGGSGGGRSSFTMSTSRGGGGGGTDSSFSLPTNITVYHLTTNPNKISKSSIYKKMRLGLQFSLGPDADETALSLSPVTGGSSSSGAGRGGANGGENSGSYFSHQSRHQDSAGLSSFSSGSASAATVLIYLEDILHVDMACEELPVDDSDCVVFHITVIRTARSTGMIDAGVAAGVAGALSTAPPAHDQPVSTLTNRQRGSSNNTGGALSMPSQLRGSSGGETEMETIRRKGGGRGGGNGGGGVTSERDPVRVTLFAPISPSVEEWVQFLNENLGDRVSLGSSLL